MITISIRFKLVCQRTIIPTMRKVHTFIQFILITLILSSCAKDNLDDSFANNQPVFHVNATIAGQEISINAGQNEFFMFTKFDQDSAEVYSFTGQFGKLINCTSDCNESLTVTLRDTEASLDALPILDRGRLFPDFYSYHHNNATGTNSIVYEIIFNDRSAFQGEPAVNSWANGSSSIGTSVLQIRDTVPQLGVEYFIDLEVADGACSTTYSKVITSDYENDCFNAIDFQIQAQGADEYKITAVPDGPNSNDWTYFWEDNFGDADTIVIAESGTYCLSIINADECSTQRCVCIDNLNSDLSSIYFSSAAFSYEVNELDAENINNPFSDTEVIIAYTDSEGKEFRSDLNSQPLASSFTIINIEDYDLDENGIPTLKLDIQFDCVLFDENGESFFLENGVASVGVAYPL